ncbi:hypothetical protein [Bartonella sp. AD13SXNS]|uniref:hypothetical protein n=1 Tax=Bartonella sp. AD13SXNS TaxID=3243462 RepID=UPI0035D05D2E
MNRLKCQELLTNTHELENNVMVPACFFINLKMALLNGIIVIPFTGATAKWAWVPDVSLKQTRECATQ